MNLCEKCNQPNTGLDFWCQSCYAKCFQQDFKNWASGNSDMFYELLKNNGRVDLQIKEIVVWDYLIQWGIEQSQKISVKSRSEWHNNNYEVLKETLRLFIPLIRFSAINMTDFIERVCPYKTIIPNNIYVETLKFI
ncbi:hypothetical protein C1645_833545 [Glomus cerebriforme]|uniref:BACK domain-containing protein n=1 Tax=Glomus cerebriforme TaxID=658196 RepID=A0A397SCC1_9GLOM|nr:hypothetical protein C1645_833545 [Glomus cerebriforme]